jgi:NAD(P)-dependent dehydrogenase (short-subunit alcohol dehydrogenase family)
MSSVEPDRPLALITGSNRGTGLAIAVELARRGYRIASLNRSLREEPWLGEERCDLADPEAVRAAVHGLLERHGRLDVCVTSAVVRELAPIAKLEPAAWERALAVNLSSVLYLIQSTLPTIRRTHGIYVFLGSHAATRFFETGAAYSATKAALKALVETLLLEERPHGVRATLISPGAIANLPDDDSAYKMATASVARCVGVLAQDLPRDMVTGELEIRPSRLPRPKVFGLDRLQFV